jgi:hypothetical protein
MICRPKTFANGRAFIDGIYTEVVCRLDSPPMIMVALLSVLTWVHKVSFKLQVCLLEVVHTPMLADVSQVEPASNNSMLLILFVCIFDKTVQIVPFLHGFFARYTNEEHVQSRQFLGYIIIFMKWSHRCLSTAVFPRPWHSPYWILFQHELLAVAAVVNLLKRSAILLSIRRAYYTCANI